MTQVRVDKVSDDKDRSLPVFTEFEKVADKIRLNAWKLFSRRGAQGGRELDDWLEAERAVCWPTAELKEHDDVYSLKIALAGFEPEEINVTATAGEVLVKAAHEQQTSAEQDDGLRWSEFHSNDVFRRVAFPQAVNLEDVTAKYRNGMLEIRAPRHLSAEEEVEKIEFDAPS